MMWNKILVSAALVAGMVGAQAQDGAPASPARGLSPFLGLGLTLGGDQIGETIRYEDGSSTDITGGGLVDLRAGLQYQAPDSALSFQLSLGYHTDDTLAAKNGSASFTRFPLEVLAHHQSLEKWRFGGGLRKALNAQTKTSGLGADYVLAQKYKSSVGVVLEAEYMPTRAIGIKLRGVSESYKPEVLGKTISGNHLGVIAVYYFNR